MLSLILNILVLFIGAGGAIVSSLTLSNPVWRKRAVIFFALMGVIGLILTVIAYENTPDVPHISDVISDVRTASFNFAKNHSWFWPILLFLFGLGAGTPLGILICKFSNRERTDRTPRVRKWIEPVDAIEAFADSKLITGSRSGSATSFGNRFPEEDAR